ncbi:hypothetical protein RAHE111665_17610 [Rariglobus hedericola]
MAARLLHRRQERNRRRQLPLRPPVQGHQDSRLHPTIHRVGLMGPRTPRHRRPVQRSRLLLRPRTPSPSQCPRRHSQQLVGRHRHRSLDRPRRLPHHTRTRRRFRQLRKRPARHGRGKNRLRSPSHHLGKSPRRRQGRETTVQRTRPQSPCRPPFLPHPHRTQQRHDRPPRSLRPSWRDLVSRRVQHLPSLRLRRPPRRPRRRLAHPVRPARTSCLLGAAPQLRPR